MVAALPQRVPLRTGRGFPGLDDQQVAQLTGQANIDDVQGFVNNGGLARALQNNPAGAQMLGQLLQKLAQNASVDQNQLSALGQSQGFANQGTDQAQGFANQPLRNNNFNPLANNQLSTPGTIGNIGSGGTDGLDDLSALGGGGGFFEDRVFAIMSKVVQDFQKQIEDRLNNLQQQAQDAQAQTQGGGQDSGGESRNIEFEKIKYDMQKLSQMQQAMSNVLDSMDELAKNAIHHIKAG